MPERRSEITIRMRLLLLSLALHAALYAPSIPGFFTFDDRKIVVQGAAVNGTAPLLSVFSQPYYGPGEPQTAFSYRPVALLSLGLDVRLFGLSPAAMRTENVVLAGASTAVLGWILLELGASAWLATATVVLSACHPVRSEAIIPIVGRCDVLAALLLLLSLYCARRALGDPRGLTWSAASGGWLALGLLTKENTFVAPALLLPLLLWPDGPIQRLRERRPSDATGGGVAAAKPLLALLVAWTLAFGVGFGSRRLVLGGWMKSPQAVIQPMDSILIGRSTSERLAGAASLFTVAMTRLTVPVTLCADYGSRSFDEREVFASGPVLAGSSLLGLLAFLAMALWRRSPFAAFGIGFSLATYLPFGNFLFVTGTALAERLLQLPAAGAALAVAAALATMTRGRSLAVGAIALLFAARIQARIPEWHDDLTLFSSVVRDYPGNGRAWFNLALFRFSAGDANGASGLLANALLADPSLRPRVEAIERQTAQLGREADRVAIHRALEASRVSLEPGPVLP